jgi:predicted ATP-grasp superfamily ATP-dependent carboligase
MQSAEEIMAAGLPFPFIIKPRVGYGSIGFHVIRDEAQLREVFPKALERFGGMVVQEYIPQTGTQYKCEVFLDADGAPKSAVVFDKTRWYPVDGGSTCCSCSVHRPDIAENSIRLLQAIGWRGYGDVDLIEDPRDGVAKVMEINPRITASVKVCFAAGVDFARQIVELGMGLPVTEYPDYRDGVRLRYMHTDVLWFLQSPNRFKAKPGWFDFRHTTDQIFSLKDPWPWFTYTVQGLRKRKTEMAKRKR